MVSQKDQASSNRLSAKNIFCIFFLKMGKTFSDKISIKFN